jgi:hypothetical protein
MEFDDFSKEKLKEMIFEETVRFSYQQLRMVTDENM